MKPQHVFLVFFGLLAVIGYFLTWGEWSVSQPPGAGPAAGWRRATLPLSYVIDLETGAVADSSVSARDLWWEGMTHTESCLCPYRRSDRDVLIARVPQAAFAGLDAGAASALEFSEAGFRHGTGGSELVAGLGFIVRTGDGNLARVRVLEIGHNRSLTLEWSMLGPAPDANAVTGNPSLESRRLLTEIRANLRGGKDRERAAVLLDEVLPLADHHAAASLERIDFLNEIGQLYWSAQRADFALAVYTRAATQIALHDATPGARPLPWRTLQQTYRWIGLLNRDAARYHEAIPWLEQSLAAARAGTATEHNEAGMQRMAITGALSELYQLECRKHDAAAALIRLKELRDTCAAMLPESSSHGACNTERLRC